MKLTTESSASLYSYLTCHTKYSPHHLLSQTLNLHSCLDVRHNKFQSHTKWQQEQFQFYWWEYATFWTEW